MSDKPANRPDDKKKYIEKLLKNGTLEKLSQGADTEKELYTALGIGKTSWLKYKEEIPELKELIIRTRHETFLDIKGAMKKRALGYDYTEEIQEMSIDVRTKEKKPLMVRKVTRHVPPDLSAQKLLIANMKKQECRNDRKDRIDELANWTNSTETIEVKTEGSVSLALDDAIKNVLKDINNDK